MSDKALIIIISILNIFMWCIAINYISTTNKKFNELIKKEKELLKKQTDYIHLAHENMANMTTMNIESMGTFISQLSQILAQQGTPIYAQEERQ